jgi:hypothetical protein
MGAAADSVYRSHVVAGALGTRRRREADMDRIATRPGLSSQVWQFARHFLEMCIGGWALNGLLFVAGPALIGYADLRQQSPELALLAIAFNYALPMALWMRFRGMEWRPTLEMSGATIGLAIVMISLDRLDFLQTSSIRSLVIGFCGPACVVMVIVMLFRLDLYTGRTGHQMGGHASGLSQG